MGSANIPSLQLPALSALEPLTAAPELSSFQTTVPEEPQAQPETPRQTVEPQPERSDRPSTPPAPSTPNLNNEGQSPPQSPERPASMRRFLSRVSMNSSFANNTNGTHDDKASVFSTPLSFSSPAGSGKKGQKKSPSSWWKRAKRHSTFIPPVQENFSGTSTATQTKTQSIAPPPKLPDDMFGANLASMDADIFKNFK